MAQLFRVSLVFSLFVPKPSLPCFQDSKKELHLPVCLWLWFCFAFIFVSFSYHLLTFYNIQQNFFLHDTLSCYLFLVVIISWLKKYIMFIEGNWKTHFLLFLFYLYSPLWKEAIINNSLSYFLDLTVCLDHFCTLPIYYFFLQMGESPFLKSNE